MFVFLPKVAGNMQPCNPDTLNQGKITPHRAPITRFLFRKISQNAPIEPCSENLKFETFLAKYPDFEPQFRPSKLREFRS
jgi:hypothetical protein